MKFRMKIDAEHVHTGLYTLTKTQRKTRYLIKMNIHAHCDIFLSAQMRKRATKRKRASERERESCAYQTVYQYNTNSNQKENNTKQINVQRKSRVKSGSVSVVRLQCVWHGSVESYEERNRVQEHDRYVCTNK